MKFIKLGGGWYGIVPTSAGDAAVFEDGLVLLSKVDRITTAADHLTAIVVARRLGYSSSGDAPEVGCEERHRLFRDLGRVREAVLDTG